MRQFLPYIHFLRGVAILYVVSVHARGFASYWESNPHLYNALDSFSDPSEGNGTTLFLFIGGFLFQHLTCHYFNFKEYIVRKFKVLIMPYLVISLPLIIIRLNTNFQSLSIPDDFYAHSVLYQVTYFLFTGSHLPPFWFISTIILFYFTAPLLHKLDNPKFYTYVFPILLLAAHFTYRPAHNANSFLSYIHFIPVYITGMWASYYKDKILSDKPTLFITLLIVYLGMCAAELVGWIDLPRDISFQDVWHDRALIFNVYMFKTLILCFLWLSAFYLLRNRHYPLLELFGSYSFGMFFVHYFFISITRRYFELQGIMFDFTLLTYFIYFLIILMVSAGAVFLVKKITGNYSRYLIGS